MENSVLHIKNMVCDRCKTSVATILEKLELPLVKVELGKVELTRPLLLKETEKLSRELQKVGFELLLEKNQRTANAIKSIIIEEVYAEEAGRQKLSSLLSEKLHYDYSHLTNLFTKMEGQSIQSFQQQIKMERAKELLEYDEFTIAEIAHILGYASAAYLSTIFKKRVGSSPSAYKTSKLRKRGNLDAF